MRMLVVVLGLLSVSLPVLAADAEAPVQETPASADAAADDVDIMNFYMGTRKAFVQESLADKQKYRDRWYDHANERYGVTLKKPEAGEMSSEPAPASASEQIKIEAAKAMFDDYKRYERALDLKIFDLYSKTVTVDITFVHQSGQTRATTLTYDEFKRVLEQLYARDRARSAGPCVYSNVTYKPFGNGIRIEGEVAEAGKLHDARPFAIMVKAGKDGIWRIERQEAQGRFH